MFLDGIHERGTDDTGRNGNHGDADETDDAAENLAQGSDRVNVAVPCGRERNDGPPEAVTDVGEDFRLSGVLKP